MNLPEYDSTDAVGLAELVRRRDVSPLELVDAAISRIDARNGFINAVVHRMASRARDAAQKPLPEGPFRGVPFLLKDLLAAYDGEPMSNGTRFYGKWIPPGHSELVTRFLRTGLIVVGKTNTPELGILPVTEPELFGPARNPWDLERTPGGSSGGSAAAVAARIVPMASGGDGGGSIRIPASCCGVFGLKPSRGRNPIGPYHAHIWEGFVVEHVLTRSVRDSAVMLDATAGVDAGAPYAAPTPARPYAEEVQRGPGKLRIAMSAEPYLAKRVHPDCRAALADAAALLRDLGHEVIEAAPKLDGKVFARAMVLMLAGQTAAEIRDAEALLGRKATHRDFESATWILRNMGETFSAGEYQTAVRWLQRAAREVASFVEGYDAFLSPTLGSPPLPIGSLKSTGVIAAGERMVSRLDIGRIGRIPGLVEIVADRSFGFIPYTPLANATGQPSMSVPLYWNAAGLPVGVMFTARLGDEATLFRLASQLEQARPWAMRVPALVSSSLPRA